MDNNLHYKQVISFLNKKAELREKEQEKIITKVIKVTDAEVEEGIDFFAIGCVAFLALFAWNIGFVDLIY